ncbi:MAG: hypothetical protein J6Y37_02990 [Paludibacteraceae bacterium]|nr:hypothetical protein [Paludibacteraceae bacterium]
MNNSTIKKIIKNKEETKNLAFIIGNGINLNFLSNSISWGTLVKDLYKEHLGANLSEEDFKGVSLTELYDILEISQRDSYKKDIAKKFSSIKSADNDFSDFVKNLHKLDVPIITTNFDTIISQLIKCEKRILKGSFPFSRHYPWNVYYSDKELDSPINGFGIWHINGIHEYSDSISLGLCDYMRNVEKTRKMLHEGDAKEYFLGKHQFNWNGSNTWLHILFNKNLFIFGLNLGENEVFLRWLLLQRTKYSQLRGLELKGWFVDKDVDDGKKRFLEMLNFDVIKIKDFGELYNVFNEELN